MRAIRKPTGLILIAFLVVANSATPARGQDTNAPTQQATNVGPVQAKAAPAAGGETNNQQTFASPPSNSISFQETKARAEKGDVKAQSWLGADYLFGRGVPRDSTNAVKWLRTAAEHGDAEAQFNLAWCYCNGSGVPQNYAKAVNWIRKAAEQGLAYAYSELGLYYRDGDGVPQNFAEAVTWFQKAAQNGDARGQYSLGVAYMEGQGVLQDYTEAIKWFQKASEQGWDVHENLVSCYDVLGYDYLTGKGFPRDYAEAVKWYCRAAEQGDAAAEYMIGLAYKNGWGVPELSESQRFAEAKKWSLKAAEQYHKAAERGETEAQETLAECFDNAHEYAEAVKWYRRAADQGNEAAQNNLGVAYQQGQGIPRNDIEAYKWFSLAAANGWEGYSERRDSLAQSLSREEVAEAQRLAAAFVARKESPEDSNRSNLPAQPGFTEIEQKASGTGFFVSENGYLVTAFHVVADAARIDVRTKAGTLPATLVKADKVNDVALLKVAGKSSALAVGSSRGVKLGESVFTIGFPNIELQGLAPKLTKGEISSLTGVQDDPREFQISVPVQPGNSGGPLVNQYGNVVGVVEAQLADITTFKATGALPQNVNYAMKSSVLNLLLESLPDVSAKLKEPNPIKDRKFEDVEKEAESAVALVLVY